MTPVVAIRSTIRWLQGLVIEALHSLRAGYPHAAPPPGHSALVALTGPQSLTKHQVAQVVQRLTAHPDGPTTTDIKVAIVKVTDQLPNPNQVTQIRRSLRS
jgi:hypothetical protein